MSSLTLISFAQSNPARNIRITLEELGVEHTDKFLDFATKEHKSAEFLEKNQPFGQTPVLWDGDYRLFESKAIMRYLASKYKSETLYPSDVQKRGLIEQWLSVHQSNSTPVSDVVSEYLIGPLLFGKTPDESKREGFQEKLVNYLSILDKAVSKTGYLVGNDLTLADIPFVTGLDILQKTPGYEKSLEAHTHLKQYYQKIVARPSFKKILV